jgi:hypothetical protein
MPINAKRFEPAPAVVEESQLHRSYCSWSFVSVSSKAK